MNKGNLPSNSKSLVIDTIQYNSKMEASRILNISIYLISRRCKSDSYPNYYYLTT